jgi:hypothetical protein
MSEKLRHKLKDPIEKAKEKADRGDAEFERLAEKAQPHVHEAGLRLAEAEAERTQGRKRGAP